MSSQINLASLDYTEHAVRSQFMYFVFYVLKQVSVQFSCLGECCHTALL